MRSQALSALHANAAAATTTEEEAEREGSLSDAEVADARGKLSEAARVGDWEVALSLLAVLVAASGARGKSWPHPRSFDDAIIACSRAQPQARWSEALEVLSQMSATGLAPRSYAFNGCIAACARAGQSGRCMALLQRMKAAGVPPDLVTFNSVLMGLAKEATAGARVSGWETACQLLTQMDDRGVEPDALSYGLAIQACRRALPAAQPGRAGKLLEAMQGRGIAPTEETLVMILTACASAGGHEALADRVWAMICDGSGSGAPPPTVRAYTARLYERGTANDWQGALAVLGEMRGQQGGEAPSSADEKCVALTARACGRAGAWEAAIDLLRACETDHGVRPTSRLYCSAIQACGKARKPEAALELLDEALEAGNPLSSSPSSGGSGGSGGGGGGGGGGGSEASEENTGAASSPSVPLYGAAMGACSAAGEWELCLSLLERMRGEGVVGDVALYGQALHALQAAKQWEGVYDVLHQMRADGVTTVKTQLAYHVTLWKRAKRELKIGTPPSKAKKKKKEKAG